MCVCVRQPHKKTNAVLELNFCNNFMDYVANPAECLSCFFSRIEYLFC